MNPKTETEIILIYLFFPLSLSRSIYFIGIFFLNDDDDDDNERMDKLNGKHIRQVNGNKCQTRATTEI